MSNVISDEEKIVIINNLTGEPFSNDDTLYTVKESSITISVADESIFRTFDTEILWDFGDGTQIKGKSATHYYSKPGLYTITYTFFDTNNTPAENIYQSGKYIASVKDIIETHLSFTEDFINKCNAEDSTLNDIKAGEIFEAAEIVAYLSNNIIENVPIKLVAKNSLSENYFNLAEQEHYKHLLPYHSFYDKKNNVIKNITPDYYPAYISFKNNEDGLYTVLYIIDKTLKLKTDKISFTNIKIDEINLVKTSEEIEYLNPTFVGKIGITKIFFKDDRASDENNQLKLYYVLDQDYFPDTNTIISKNLINLVSLGIGVNIKSNILDGTEKIFISTNGLVSNSILADNIEDINDISFNTYAFNTAKYKNVQSPFVVRLLSNSNSPYFIKDITIDNIIFEQNNLNNFYISSNKLQDYYNYGSALCTLMPLKESTDNELTIKLNINGLTYTYSLSDIEIIDFKSFEDKNSVYFLNPKQNGEDFSIINFWRAYQTHPAVQDKDELTKYIYALFGTDDLLKKLIDKGFNFIDDTNNIQTCSIKNIISTSESLNQIVDLYNDENFSHPIIIDELLKICSINHSKLVGVIQKSEDEFESVDHLPGKNRGSEISLTEHIIVKRANESTFSWPKIVCYDKFAKIYKVLNTALLEKEFLQSALHLDEEGNTYFILNEYFMSWGWNLILGTYEGREDTYILTPDKAPNITELKVNDAGYYKAEKNINHFYTFYHYIETEDYTVENSYLEPETISDNIRDYETWYKKDGSIDRLLYKALIENLNL